MEVFQVDDKIFISKASINDLIERWNDVLSSDAQSYSRVLSWVLKVHSDALVAIASEIAPFLTTRLGINEETQELFMPTSTSDNLYEANIDSLLLRTPLLNLPRNYFEILIEAKKGVDIQTADLERIKNKVDEALRSIVSTKDAAEALWKAALPLSNVESNFAKLKKTDAVTKVGDLRKFEKAIEDFKKNIGKQGLNRFTQIDPSLWEDRAKGHKIDILDIETKSAYYQYPCLNWHPLNIHTDLERMVIPFFRCLENIEDLYLGCRDLFEKCKGSSGFMRGPPKELAEKAAEALNDFNVCYGGLAFSYDYSHRMFMRAKDIEQYDIRRKRSHKTMKEVEQLIKKGDLKNAEEIIMQIYETISWLNDVRLYKV